MGKSEVRRVEGMNIELGRVVLFQCPWTGCLGGEEVIILKELECELIWKVIETISGGLCGVRRVCVMRETKTRNHKQE